MQPRPTRSLLALLAAPTWAAASPAKPVTQAWAWLTSLWNAVGCSLNPSGCAGAVDRDDIGCTIDPNGCAAAFRGDVGCSMDPDGCAAVMDQRDVDCSLDPNGCSK